MAYRNVWSGLILLALWPLSAASTSVYNCSDGIVSVGDSTYEVSKRCGTPSAVETVSAGGADSIAENWYYDRGGKIPYVFRMRDGRLKAIDRLKQ